MRVLEESEVRQRLFPAEPSVPYGGGLEQYKPARDRCVRENLEALLHESLFEEGRLTLSGVGTFRLQADGTLEFEPWQRKRVFLAYVREDTATVLKLFRYLRRNGMDPWMDIVCLLPGQNWPRAIERAVEVADFFVPCYSRAATSKRSHFQSEVRMALRIAERVPLDEPFLVPVRLDACTVPEQIRQQTQYLDLFPELHKEIPKLLAALLPDI